MKPTLKKLSLVVVIIINLLLIFYVYLSNVQSKHAFPSRLPDLALNTASGKEYRLNNSHHFTLIHFIQPHDRSSVQNVENLHSFFGKTSQIDSLSILIFTRRPEALEKRFSESRNVFIFHRDEFPTNLEFRESHFYLYNKNGSLLKDGPSFMAFKNLIWFISEVLASDSMEWEPAAIVKVGENIASNKYLRFLQKYILNSAYTSYIFIFLNDVCSTCQSGMVVRSVNKMQSETHKVKYYIVLPTAYQDNDLQNLKNNDNLKINFARRSHEIEDYAVVLMNRTLVSSVNGLAVSVDKEGTILFVMDLMDEQDRLRVSHLDSLALKASFVK